MATASADPGPNEAYLKVVANPENALLDIIAVHGMNPRNDLHHPNKTWTHQESGTHWLRDLLPSSVPHARIMAYQYNANVAFDSSTAGVQEQAVNLLQLILAKRQKVHAHSRPILIIAHSLGGIVVKQALATAYNTSSGELATIYVLTFALFLFGVPHRGSSVPQQAWASVVRRIFQLCGISTNSSFLNSVTEGSSYAEQLQSNFKPLLDFYNVFTVCETKEERGFGIVGGSRITENPGWLLTLKDRPERVGYPGRFFRLISLDTQGVSRQGTQSIDQVIEQAQNSIGRLQADHEITRDLDQVVHAQTVEISRYTQFWGGIILTVLSIISWFVVLPVPAFVAKASLGLPSPVVVIQAAEGGLERQQKIVDLTKQAIKAIDSECRSAIQTHNTLQASLVTGTSSSTVPEANQPERVRPPQSDLDREIARTVQKTHRLTHLNLAESERSLKLMHKTVEKMKSLENADSTTFWMEISPYAKEEMEAERQHRLENGPAGNQQEDDPACPSCVIL